MRLMNEKVPTDVRLLSLDLDGTLLTIDKKITPRTKAAITALRERGTVVVLNSGRPRGGVIRYADALDLGANDFIISNTGAATHRVGEDAPIHELTLSLADFATIKKVVNAPVQPVLATESAMYVEGAPNDAVLHEAQVLKADIFPLEKATDALSFRRMMFMGEIGAVDIAEKEIQKLGDRYLLMRNETWFVELLPLGSGKGTALRTLAKDLNFPIETVMAVGDGANDIEMLQKAGISVVMENAVDAAKREADFIIGHHNEEGLALFLTSILDAQEK